MQDGIRRKWPGFLVLALLLAACGQAIGPAALPQETESPTQAVEEDEEYQWVQLLGLDDIAPIYEPEFVAADQSGYSDSELVMGVEIGDEAKAYPIGLLNRREMVNDEMAGIPYLVTW
jgi:hypothetical protein